MSLLNIFNRKLQNCLKGWYLFFNLQQYLETCLDLIFFVIAEIRSYANLSFLNCWCICFILFLLSAMHMNALLYLILSCLWVSQLVFKSECNTLYYPHTHINRSHMVCFLNLSERYLHCKDTFLCPAPNIQIVQTLSLCMCDVCGTKLHCSDTYIIHNTVPYQSLFQWSMLYKPVDLFNKRVLVTHSCWRSFSWISSGVTNGVFSFFSSFSSLFLGMNFLTSLAFTVNCFPRMICFTSLCRALATESRLPNSIMAYLPWS